MFLLWDMVMVGECHGWIIAWDEMEWDRMG